MIVQTFTVGAFQENCYLLVDERTNRAVIVDPGSEGERLVEAVDNSTASLDAIWITHAHVDHVGAIASIKRRWDVPIYLHPSVPLPAVMEAYYKDYAKDFPMVVRAAWGYTVETATHAIRLVLGGVFDAYPGLKVVLGHLGETLPFLVWRVGQAPARAARRR